MATFAVQSAAAYSNPTRVSKPVQVSCWTKTSSQEGGEYCFGDEAGAWTAMQLVAALAVTDGIY